MFESHFLGAFLLVSSKEIV